MKIGSIAVVNNQNNNNELADFILVNYDDTNIAPLRCTN